MADEQKIDGNEVCVCLHTALRKYCDSKITSAAWNLIHLICNSKLKPKHSPWSLLGAWTAEQMEKGDNPTIAVKYVVENLDDLYFDRVVEERRKQGKSAYPKNVRLWLYALQCTIQCFDESDWEGFVALLERE